MQIKYTDQVYSFFASKKSMSKFSHQICVFYKAIAEKIYTFSTHNNRENILNFTKLFTLFA